MEVKQKSFFQIFFITLSLVICLGAVSATEQRYINFEISPVATIDSDLGNSDTRNYSGGIWVSPTGDVVGEHLNSGNPDLVDTPLENSNLPGGANGHVAAMWEFEITGSSGDNWDAILSGGLWEFNVSWRNGDLMWTTPSGEGSPNIGVKDIFFSHIGGNTLGEWVNNNNQEATPGDQVDDVWTYIEFENPTELYGSKGIFAVIVEDENDVMQLQELGDNAASIDGLDPESNGEWATYLAALGTGKLEARDATVPELEEVTPTDNSNIVYYNENDSFVLTVDASDEGNNLQKLEIDHSLEGTLPEFSVYANESNPYGEDEADFVAAGVTVTYNEQNQEWTIDFGQSITDVFISNAGITFYIVIHDIAGNQFGTMFGTTPENTFKYTIEEDDTIPSLENLTPTQENVTLSINGSFVLIVDASDEGNNLQKLEIDHSLEGTLSEFSVYPIEENPYGDNTTRDEFQSFGVNVNYDSSEQTWTIDFGQSITDVFVSEGITFYLVIEDLVGNRFGSMSPTTPENTFPFTIVKDETIPTLENVTPVQENVTLSANGSFVFSVDANDEGDNLYSLEVDHSLQNILPEFTVYASEENPYGSQQAKTEFENLGASVSYDAQNQEWTIDFGQSITDVIVDNDGIEFYIVIEDIPGNQFGTMFGTTPENTFTYNIERDLTIPYFESVLPEVDSSGVLLNEEENFVLKINAEDEGNNLELLEVRSFIPTSQLEIPDFELQVRSSERVQEVPGTVIPQLFTLYANESNPYGDNLDTSEFVDVTYNASTKIWTLEFYSYITEQMISNQSENATPTLSNFGFVLKDKVGNQNPEDDEMYEGKYSEMPSLPYTYELIRNSDKIGVTEFQTALNNETEFDNGIILGNLVKGTTASISFFNAPPVDFIDAPENGVGLYFEIHGNLSGNGTIKIPLSLLDGYLENTLEILVLGEGWSSCPINTSIQGNYLVCNTNHFSTWTVSGEEEPEPSSSSGGGGSGSSPEVFEMTLPQDRDETFELDVEDRVEVELEGEIYTFENEDNSNGESTLSFDGDEHTFDEGDEMTFDLNNDGQDDLIIILEDGDIFGSTFNFLAVEEDEEPESDLELTFVDSSGDEESSQENESNTSAFGSNTQANNQNSNDGTSNDVTTQETNNLGGNIVANIPTILGIILALLVILGIVWYVFSRRKKGLTN